MSCFKKLHSIISKNNLSLWKVFSDFDKKNNCLREDDFKALIRKICEGRVEISDGEIKAGFMLID